MTKEYSRLIVCVLSLIFPGLGHIYLDERKRGFAFILAFIIFYLICVTVIMNLSAWGIFFYIAAIWDGLDIAKKKNDQGVTITS